MQFVKWKDVLALSLYMLPISTYKIGRDWSYTNFPSAKIKFHYQMAAIPFNHSKYLRLYKFHKFLQPCSLLSMNSTVTSFHCR